MTCHVCTKSPLLAEFLGFPNYLAFLVFLDFENSHVFENRCLISKNRHKEHPPPHTCRAPKSRADASRALCHPLCPATPLAWTACPQRRRARSWSAPGSCTSAGRGSATSKGTLTPVKNGAGASRWIVSEHPVCSTRRAAGATGMNPCTNFRRAAETRRRNAPLPRAPCASGCRALPECCAQPVRPVSLPPGRSNNNRVFQYTLNCQARRRCKFSQIETGFKFELKRAVQI